MQGARRCPSNAIAKWHFACKSEGKPERHGAQSRDGVRWMTDPRRSNEPPHHPVREQPTATISACAWTSEMAPARRSRSGGGSRAGHAARCGGFLTHSLRTKRGGRDAAGPHESYERTSSKTRLWCGRLKRCRDQPARRRRCNSSCPRPIFTAHRYAPSTLPTGCCSSTASDSKAAPASRRPPRRRDAFGRAQRPP